MVIEGLDRGLRLRGAASIGQVVSSERNVLGPVVTDVASWYETPDLIGVVATPNCGQHLNYLQVNPEKFPTSSKGQPIPMDRFFRKYDVPLKGNLCRKLWVVNWPFFISALHKKRDPLDWYYSLTRGFLIPIGTEQKYDNTERFITEMLAKKMP